MDKFLNALDKAHNWIVVAGLLLLGCFLAALPFSKGGEIAQAIGNILGAAIGTLGAYSIARWTFVSSERARDEVKRETAVALFNAVRGRYQSIKKLAKRMNDACDSLASNSGRNLSAADIQFEFLPIEETTRERIAASFVSANHEITELDDTLILIKKNLDVYVKAKNVRYPDDKAVLLSLRKIAEAALDALDCWEKIVDECDDQWRLIGEVDKFGSDLRKIKGTARRIKEFEKSVIALLK